MDLAERVGIISFLANCSNTPKRVLDSNMEKHADIQKVLAVAGGSVVGALVGNAVVPQSPIASAAGAGVVAGVVKRYWSIQEATDAGDSKDGSVMQTLLNLPWMCMARVGGLTAMFHYVMPWSGKDAKQALAVASWMAGASEIVVVDTFKST